VVRRLRRGVSRRARLSVRSFHAGASRGHPGPGQGPRHHALSLRIEVAARGDAARGLSEEGLRRSGRAAEEPVSPDVAAERSVAEGCARLRRVDGFGAGLYRFGSRLRLAGRRGCSGPSRRRRRAAPPTSRSSPIVNPRRTCESLPPSGPYESSPGPSVAFGAEAPGATSEFGRHVASNGGPGAGVVPQRIARKCSKFTAIGRRMVAT